MAADWELLKAVRAAIKAGKDIPDVKIEELCRTIETQDQEIGQKTQEYASLFKQNATISEDLLALGRQVDFLVAENEKLKDAEAIEAAVARDTKAAAGE